MSEPINPSDLARRLAEPDRPVLVDVRLEEDYALAHLPESKTNCVFEVAFLDRMGNVAPDKRAAVCVYGATADSYEARMAAEKLCRVGYTRVLELREGLEGWKSAGLPLEGGADSAIAETRPHPTAGSMLMSPRAAWNGWGEICSTNTMDESS